MENNTLSVSFANAYKTQKLELVKEDGTVISQAVIPIYMPT